MKKLVSLFMATLIVAGVLCVALPQAVSAETYTTTTYYYYTTQPGAGPIVINGITYYPCSTMPGASQPVQQVPIQQVQQPVCQVPQQQFVCPQTGYVYPQQTYPQYINGAVMPTPMGNNGQLVVQNRNTGIIQEADKRTNDVRYYGVDRGWSCEVVTTQDTDCINKRQLKFSNKNGSFSVEQVTALNGSGNYTTGWWWNGQQSSVEAIQQTLSSYCAH